MPSKVELRKATWQILRDAKQARFPGARGRIPNFIGAEAAAARLTRTPEWQQARTLKCNPDSPQRPVRRAALEAGKVVYMAVPKLASDHPFLELDPAHLDPKALWPASSIKGAAAMGRPVTLDEMPAIDLIVTGCVAVSKRGGRLGKGGGYSDLEYALLREAGKVGPETPIATTVHRLQRVDDVPMTDHDLFLDLVVTEARIFRTRNRPPRPEGILWDHLSPEKQAAIPVLADRRRVSSK